MALRASDEASWIDFFTSAGIPVADSTAYAKIFVKNRLNEKTAVYLTADNLKDIGISVLGDIIAIMNHIE